MNRSTSFVFGLCGAARSVTVLDHHKTAIDEFTAHITGSADGSNKPAPLPSNLTLRLPLDMSGATATLSYLSSVWRDSIHPELVATCGANAAQQFEEAMNNRSNKHKPSKSKKKSAAATPKSPPPAGSAAAPAPTTPASPTTESDDDDSGGGGAGSTAVSDLWLSGRNIAQIHRLFALTQDADLWSWKIAQSREFHRGVLAAKFEYDPSLNTQIWSDLLSINIQKMAAAGAAIIKHEEQLIAAELAKSFPIRITGTGTGLAGSGSGSSTTDCLAVITGQSSIRSELGHQLANASAARGLRGIGAIAYTERDLASDVYKVSFRSVANENVALLAQQFGGGGHAAASSCVVKMSVFDAWRAGATASVAESKK